MLTILVTVGAQKILANTQKIQAEHVGSASLPEQESVREFPLGGTISAALSRFAVASEGA